MDEPRVTVGGDAESGWMVDVHDGDRHGAYSPEAADADEARTKALAMHADAAPSIPPAASASEIVAHVRTLVDEGIAAAKAEWQALLANAHARIESLGVELAALRNAAPPPSPANDQDSQPVA